MAKKTVLKPGSTRLYTAREAATYLGVGLHHMKSASSPINQRVPRVVLGPRCVRYMQQDLDDYIKAFEDEHVYMYPAGSPFESARITKMDLMTVAETALYFKTSPYVVRKSKFFKENLQPIFIKSRAYYKRMDVHGLARKAKHFVSNPPSTPSPSEEV